MGWIDESIEWLCDQDNNDVSSKLSNILRNYRIAKGSLSGIINSSIDQGLSNTLSPDSESEKILEDHIYDAICSELSKPLYLEWERLRCNLPISPSIIRFMWAHFQNKNVRDAYILLAEIEVALEIKTYVFESILFLKNNNYKIYSELRTSFEDLIFRYDTLHQQIINMDGIELSTYIHSIEQKLISLNPSNNKNKTCLRCKSSHVEPRLNGINVKAAFAGTLLLGPIGLVSGLIGMGKVMLVCQNCGLSWYPKPSYSSWSEYRKLPAIQNLEIGSDKYESNNNDYSDIQIGIMAEDNKTIFDNKGFTISVISSLRASAKYKTIMNFHSISAGYIHSLGIKQNGDVCVTGANTFKQCDINSWNDVITVSAGTFFSVGLKKDGHVVVSGSNLNSCSDIANWNDIISVKAGTNHIVGLRNNGEVVAVGKNEFGECKVNSWSDIVDIAVGKSFTLGLKSDGSVISTGNNEYSQCNVYSWSNIIAIAAGSFNAFGLKDDGHVISSGYVLSTWTDVITISAGSDHVVGLRSDGTVLADGSNHFGQCNVDSWKDIIAISAGETHTLGLHKNGTVYGIGNNDNNQCNVNEWRDIGR